MLKITLDDEAHGGPVLKLEGHVCREWVDELRKAYLTVRASGREPLALDLENVRFIDAAGVAFFDEIYPDVRFVNCSLFAAEQLKVVSLRHEAV